MPNVLNDSNKPPVSNGNPAHPDAQGSIRSPLDGFRNPPRSQHPALKGGIAGNTPITNPLTPRTPRG